MAFSTYSRDSGLPPVDPTNYTTKSYVDAAIPVAGSWTNVTFLNSWAKVNENVAYRLEMNGDVRLIGRMSGGASGTNAFNLPSAVRPAVRHDFVLATNVDGSFGAISVGTSGNCSVYIPAGATWVSLSPVRFPLVSA